MSPPERGRTQHHHVRKFDSSAAASFAAEITQISPSPSIALRACIRSLVTETDDTSIILWITPVQRHLSGEAGECTSWRIAAEGEGRSAPWIVNNSS